MAQRSWCAPPLGFGVTVCQPAQVTGFLHNFFHNESQHTDIKQVSNGLVPDEGVPLGTAWLIYTAVGAASVLVLLTLIGLSALIVMKLKNKQGEPNCDEAVPFHTYAACCVTHSTLNTLDLYIHFFLQEV